jgi:hypothetical protein
MVRVRRLMSELTNLRRSTPLQFLLDLAVTLAGCGTSSGHEVLSLPGA